MQSTPDSFRHWRAPAASEIGKDHIDFLHILREPTWITLDGVDITRQHIIVTLLHGNEPSGLRAVHDFLLSGEKPEINLGIFVVSVNTALRAPIFSHRYPPEEQDFNRCFGQPDDTNQEKPTTRIVETLHAFQPKAIVDTHNTTAHSEPFAVSISEATAIQQLSQVFTRCLVVLDQILRKLIEQPLGCPLISVEFGGLMNPRADLLARDTLLDFINRKHLLDTEALATRFLMHPLRLEVHETAQLHYSSSVQDKSDITIFNTIDQLNFSRIETGTPFGWLGNDRLKPLRVLDRYGQDLSRDLFDEHEGFLITKAPMTMFMATKDSYIAVNDRLMYLCPERQ